MKASKEIGREIEGIKGKLKTIKRTIAVKDLEMQMTKESQARLVEMNVGRSRTPKSITIQRQLLQKLNQETVELETAKERLEHKLADLEKQDARALLFKNHVLPYREADKSFWQQMDGISKAINVANEKIASTKTTMDDFLQHKSDNPALILRAIVTDPAVQGVSLRKFIMDGEIEEGSHAENMAFVQEMANRYRTLSINLPMVDAIKDSWIKLSDQLHFLSRVASDLVPRTSKYKTSQTPEPKPVEPVHRKRQQMYSVDPAEQKRLEDLVRAQKIKSVVVDANA